MTGLLVSVRDAREAREAWSGGADVIDVKEPLHGALGAAAASVWEDVRRVLPESVPLSIALGELTDPPDSVHIQRVPRIQFAKVGLAGSLGLTDWQQQWRRLLDQLPDTTQRVAVGYADHVAAGAPTPRDVLRAAPQAGCRTFLLDTFQKDQGDLFAHLDDGELSDLARECRRSNIRLVLAGSLRQATLERALALAPQLVAVRGAACRGDRDGTLCGELVKRLKTDLARAYASKFAST